jgi:ribosomal protein L1
MNEDNFNLEMRKFLKKVGITSQREIERAVQSALEAGTLKGDESIKAIMTLELPELGVVHAIEGEIALDKD